MTVKEDSQSGSTVGMGHSKGLVLKKPTVWSTTINLQLVLALTPVRCWTSRGSNFVSWLLVQLQGVGPYQQRCSGSIGRSSAHHFACTKPFQ
jgi:hypothetical protein